jgi:hypothetical protein
MDKRMHSLITKEIDDDGVVNKYEDFAKIDFSNEFQPTEQADYEIHASQNVKNKTKEEKMKGTRKASYIDELSSGYDAVVQNDYEAGKGQKGQIGKEHEEEVAASNNWDSDKRDSIGRAASIKTLRRTAAKLNKLADVMEDYDDEEEDEKGDDVDIDSDDDLEEDEMDKGDEEMIAAATAEISKSAAHPLEHNEGKDDPEADGDSQMGDEDWVDIGAGTFDDKRDDVGRANDNE